MKNKNERMSRPSRLKVNGESSCDFYSSGTERLLVCHTCKSRACPSCGYRATSFWQEELATVLPNTFYVGVNFTMPSVLWPFFQQNRHLLNDLAAVGASAIRHWIKARYGVCALVMGVPQSFGGLLNFNPHLHMLVSAGGLQEADGRWITPLRFDKRELMQMWRLALLVYLWAALQAGAIKSALRTEQLQTVLTAEHRRDWVMYISPFMSKSRFLRYAGRYIRRPPIPLNHITSITDREVHFVAKDTKAKRIVDLHWPKEMFVATLSEHVPDRYRHGMRYFGLLAPRCKRRTSAALFVLLKQKNRSGSPRLSWADSLFRDFGVNPLRDSRGRPMRWIGRLKPGSQIDVI